jgi:hypothetical protein
MEAHYNRQAQEIVQGIVQEQYDRLADVMESLSHCCGYDEFTGKDGDVKQKKRKIYEGTLAKAKQYCDDYRQFNLTDDTRLTEVVEQLGITLRGVDAEMLRESEATRAHVKDGVDDILAKFAPRNTSI